MRGAVRDIAQHIIDRVMSRKTDKADLQKRYPIYIELGLIVALGALIVAFRLDLRPEENTMDVVQEQETVQMEEIQPTEQVTEPPPPPKPPVPVEVPNSEELENQNLDFDAALDINEAPTGPPPPPPDEEEEEEEQTQEVFVAVEDMPQMLPDRQTALKNLMQSIQYPEMAKRAGVEGRVIVQFIVDEQGNVTNPQVLQGKGAGLDKEAIRVVQQLKFKPGQQRGQPVKVKMALPINFQLN